MLKAVQGRKTYFLAAAVCVAGVGLVFFGKLTPTTAVAVILFAMGMFAATFRAALEQHQEQVVKVLVDVAALGKAASMRNVAAAIAAGSACVQDGAALDIEIEGAKS